MHAGLYEALLTLAIQQDLDQLSDPRLYSLAPIDHEDAHSALAQFLEHALASSLASFRGAETAERQKRLVDRIIGALTDELGADWTDNLSISTPLRRLLAVHADPRDTPPDRPDTPLARSALLTGTRLDPSLGSQLRKEIATADRIDILCSFIKWSGLRVLIDELRQLAARPAEDRPRIRVITTSYMGATDPRAVEALSCAAEHRSPSQLRYEADSPACEGVHFPPGFGLRQRVHRVRQHVKRGSVRGPRMDHQDQPLRVALSLGARSRARSRRTGRMMSSRCSRGCPRAPADGRRPRTGRCK